MTRLRQRGRFFTRGDAPRVIPQVRSEGVERDYFSSLLAVTRAIEEMVKGLILPALEGIAQDQRSRLGLTIDAPTDDIEELLQRAREGFAASVPDRTIAGLAERAADASSAVNREQVQAQLQALGSPLFSDAVGLGTLQRGFVKDNTTLIKDIPRKAFTDIEGILSRGLAKGARHGTLAKEISERLEITRKRAKLIARDQVSKYNAELTRQRHLASGITHSIWRTVGDERVRDEHAAREGQKFSNALGIEGEFPGEPINCRCTAEPVLDQGGIAA